MIVVLSVLFLQKSNFLVWTIVNCMGLYNNYLLIEKYIMWNTTATKEKNPNKKNIQSMYAYKRPCVHNMLSVNNSGYILYFYSVSLWKSFFSLLDY